MPPEDRRILQRTAPEADASWRYGSEPDHVADLYIPSGAALQPIVVLIHGGFWRPEFDRSHLRPMAKALAVIGHPTVLVEYRRIPGAPDAGLADIRTALQGLGSEVDTTAGVVLVGHSAGGHLALVVAADQAVPATGCLVLAPVADLSMAERLHLDQGAVSEYLGEPASLRIDLDPCRLPRPAVPVTVVHGGLDSVVPSAVGKSYCDRHRIRMVEVLDCGHFELIDPSSDGWRSVITELSALARPSGIE
jgi:acetyl esterase/lipase